MIERIVRSFPTLGRFPQMGRSRDEIHPQVRSFPVGSYVIWYRPTPNGVEILRVLHGARDFRRILREELGTPRGEETEAE